jgi:hypothetical protein
VDFPDQHLLYYTVIRNTYNHRSKKTLLHYKKERGEGVVEGARAMEERRESEVIMRH